MGAAARVGDATDHLGAISGPGIPTVLIGGAPAAVAGDSHMCGAPSPGHPPSAFIGGSATVEIGGRPALRAGDASACGGRILGGLPNVQIGG